MVRHTLVPTLALPLLLLGAPSSGAAGPPAGPRPDEPHGRWAAALLELRDLVAPWWLRPADDRPVSTFGASEDPDDLQGSHDPNGLQGSHGPNGVETPSTGSGG